MNNEEHEETNQFLSGSALEQVKEVKNVSQSMCSKRDGCTAATGSERERESVSIVPFDVLNILNSRYQR
jgi:hypothetical protein